MRRTSSPRGPKMKRSRFIQQQIVRIVKTVERGHRWRKRAASRGLRAWAHGSSGRMLEAPGAEPDLLCSGYFLMCTTRRVHLSKPVQSSNCQGRRAGERAGRTTRVSACKLLIINYLAGATGLEPAISGLTGRRVNQLHHAPAPRCEHFLVGSTGFEPVTPCL